MHDLRHATRYSIAAQARHQASVSQLRDFVGKLGGLQAEHRALQLRKREVHNDTPLTLMVEPYLRRHRIVGAHHDYKGIGSFQQVAGNTTKSVQNKDPSMRLIHLIM